MDLEIVVKVISNECKNSACQKEIGEVTKTYYRKLFHGFPVSIDPRQLYQDSNVNHPEFYSAEILQRARISSTEHPILQSYLSNRYNTLEVLPERAKNKMSALTKIDNNENWKRIVLAKDNQYVTKLSEKNITKYESVEPKYTYGKSNSSNYESYAENNRNKPEALCFASEKKECFPKSLDTRVENESERVNLSIPLSIPSTALHKNHHNFMMDNDSLSRNSYSFMRTCKKPRNLHDFSKQLKDAQIYPEIYPALFTNPKTQFLSTLGLVPKMICSKRILSKFTKEQRKRLLMEKRRSWFVGERKVLRDRNKLNKRNSHRLKMRHEAYGSLSKSRSSPFYNSSTVNSQKIRNYNFKKLKNIAKRPLRGHTEKTRMIKPQVILPEEPKENHDTAKKYPEIIDISSSDDESPAFQNFKNIKSEPLEPQIQFDSSSKQGGSSQYADIRLFGCNAENEEAVRNQMFYQQNFGFNGVFGAPNLFFSQNNVVNFPLTSNNPYQPNDSFFVNSQTPFPIMRPFLIPALSNSDFAVLQNGNFPMIRPLRPVNSPNINPYFKNLQPLPKSTNSSSEQSENSTVDDQCLFASDANITPVNKESGTNINPVQHQASQQPPDFKVILVNKTPKKTYLLIPPNCKTYLNAAKKIIPILDRKQPIAPRISGSEKTPLKYKVAKKLQQRRLNEALLENVNYSVKQKESKKDIQNEMARLSSWISKLKSSITPTNFQRGVEKFSNRLTNQLNVGITLVKGVRNALIETEKNEENIVGDPV